MQDKILDVLQGRGALSTFQVFLQLEADGETCTVQDVKTALHSLTELKQIDEVGDDRRGFRYRARHLRLVLQYEEQCA